MLKRWVKHTAERMGFRIERLRARPTFLGEERRYEFQRRYVNFDIRSGQRVLDIGSGNDPFPHATVLTDRFLEPTRYRHTKFRADNKPIVISDVQHLPFADKSFDFVYCAHLLEHMDDPLTACGEIMRVGRRGYIETPTLAKDMLFAWAAGMHKWHVQAIAQTLVFFEYLPRLAKGIDNPAWRRIIFDRHHHPLQDAFYENQDVFNTMLSWCDRFDVVVFRLDGSIEASNGELTTTPPLHIARRAA